jgi:hypothetical protein
MVVATEELDAKQDRFARMLLGSRVVATRRLELGHARVHLGERHTVVARYRFEKSESPLEVGECVAATHVDALGEIEHDVADLVWSSAALFDRAQAAAEQELRLDVIAGPVKGHRERLDSLVQLDRRRRVVLLDQRIRFAQRLDCFVVMTENSADTTKPSRPSTRLRSSRSVLARRSVQWCSVIIASRDLGPGGARQGALRRARSQSSGSRGDVDARVLHFECLLELVDEEFLGVTMFTPPFVLRFKPPLGLSEQDDVHDAPGTA